MSSDAGSIDVGGLLTIDVASELRKLSQAQLQGPWQIPAELVRRAIRDGATRIDVTLGRHRARVIDDGVGISADHLEWAGVLLDEGRSNEDRHAALTALESSGELVLLALAGLGARSLRITAVRAGRRAILEVRPGRAPWLTVDTPPLADGTDVELASPEIDRKRAHEWMVGAVRFAPADVRLEGRKLNAGFIDCYPAAPLHAPLRGRIAIPFAGDTAHAWLLEHGLVTGHVAVPEAPCFEAAIELGGSSIELSAARLREAVQPHVAELVQQGVGVLARLGREAPGLPELARARLARLILQAARRGLKRRAVHRVPVFRVVDSDGDRCVDLDTVLEVAGVGRGEHTMFALYPDQPPERFALGSTLVLVADEVERSLLADLFELRFAPPELRDGSSSLLAAWRRLVFAIGRSASRTLEAIRHPLRRPPIADEALRPDERGLVIALRRHAARGRHRTVQDVRMCEGAGPVRRLGGSPPGLLLPRDNPTVRASVIAVARDVRWIYPVWLALLDGQALPPRPVRAEWRRTA
jgi:hypothetical protein